MPFGKLQILEIMISNARNIVNAESRMTEFIYSVVRTELGQLDYVDVVNDENSETRFIE